MISAGSPLNDRDLRSQAIDIANSILSAYIREHGALQPPIALEHIAARWGMTVNFQSKNQQETPENRLHKISGYVQERDSAPVHSADPPHNISVPSSAQQLPLSMSSTPRLYDAYIYTNGYRGRFTLAHELVHVVIHESFPHVEARYDHNTLEHGIIDEAAGRILLPDQVLADVVGTAHQPLGVAELERMSRTLEVSLSALIKRVGDANRDSIVSVTNLLLLTGLDRSRKKDQNLAPRVVVRSTPLGIYLPRNQRLTSLGLGDLALRFFDRAPYQQFNTYDEITLWYSRERKKRRVKLSFTSKIYVRGGHFRTMLTVSNTDLT